MSILSPTAVPVFKTLADCICNEDHLSLVFDNTDPFGPNGCWVWLLRPDAKGYGVKQHNHLLYKAHRFVYETLVEPIPTHLTLDHLCLVKLCVNPDHLEPVPRTVNTARMHTHFGHRAMDDFPDDDPRHGTLSAYTNLKCRCSRCREANRAWGANYRLTHPRRRKVA
jgi:hypothetical protein